MNAGHVSDKIFQLGRIMSSSMITGASDILFQIATGIGFDGDEEVIDDVVAFGAFGIVGLPRRQETIDGREYACEVIFERCGADAVRPIAFRDLRWNRMFPNGLAQGDVAFVGYGGQVVKLGADGSISIVTTDDGTKDGRLVQMQLRRDGFSWVGPWGALKLDSTGFHAQHHTGARIDLGGIGGMPPPLDTMGAYARLSAPIVQLEGSAISFGPVGIPGEPVVKATTLQAYLTGIEATLGILATAIDAKVPSSPGVTVGAVSTAIAALQAAKVAMASLSTGAA